MLHISWLIMGKCYPPPRPCLPPKAPYSDAPGIKALVNSGFSYDCLLVARVHGYTMHSFSLFESAKIRKEGRKETLRYDKHTPKGISKGPLFTPPPCMYLKIMHQPRRQNDRPFPSRSFLFFYVTAARLSQGQYKVIIIVMTLSHF